jgi:hypothetical protein
MGRKEMRYIACMPLMRNAGNISVGNVEWMITFRH